METQSHFSKIIEVLRSRTLHEIVVVLAVVGAVVGYGEYRRYFLVTNINAIQQEQRINREGFETRILSLEEKLAVTEEKLLALQNESTSSTLALKTQLEGQQSKTDAFQTEINTISNTVGTLDKLSKTDSELLQKYSKVYFLNEHYVPIALTSIDPRFATDTNKDLRIHANVAPFLARLLSDAEISGFHIKVTSAFRSFGAQSILKSSYKFTYGSGTANQFSAEQGYSEHQLGTTIDFVTSENNSLSLNFDKTLEFTWLVNNAYKYGFIISYPKDNAYYQYEPWHWRFVGVALATTLHNQNKYFYDYDQREINTYLANIFD